MSAHDEAAQTFEPHRRRLTGLAYRMLGSLSEAEDIVQDAYLRWHAADRTAIANPRGYLSSTVARLCLDYLKSARVKRETYVGPWLPEPIADEAALSPETASELADDLSMALMMTLERLSPLERAAFLLHDVFDMDFAEIGKVLGRSAAACRQLAARARTHVQDARPRFQPPADVVAQVSEAFHQAILSGDVATLGRVLARDAVFYSDGGGKRAAALNPIHGSERITRFLVGLMQKGKLPPASTTVRRATLNGLPGFVISHEDGSVETLAIEIRDGRIAAIYAVRNPDKLGHLKDVSPEK
jgi:RNA polymerase sigma-70 factor (ECF subfamily)